MFLDTEYGTVDYTVVAQCHETAYPTEGYTMCRGKFCYLNPRTFFSCFNGIGRGIGCRGWSGRHPCV